MTHEEDADPPHASLHRGGARDGHRQAARALLRPRLRAGVHAVHRAHVGPADLGGHRARDARARGAVVGVGRLRVADERHRPRGGRGSPRRVRRDGRAARRARSASPRPSATKRSRSRSRTESCARRTSRCSCSAAATILRCVVRSSDSRSAQRSGWGCCWAHRSSTAPPRVRCGHWRSCSTGVRRRCSARMDGGWCPVTSPSVTISSSSSRWVSRSSRSGSRRGPPERRSDHGGRARAHARRCAVVDVLRRRRARDRTAPHACDGGSRAQHARPRLLLLPPLPDGRRDRARRSRTRGHAGPRR